MCHLFLLLPFAALPLFWLVPIPMAIAIYAVVLAISVGVYVGAWRAMRLPSLLGSGELIGAFGRVAELRERSATVWIHGVCWTAEFTDRQFAVGDVVEVIGRQGFRLKVRRCNEDEAPGLPPGPAIGPRATV